MANKLYEHYNVPVGPYAVAEVADVNWYGQTFTPVVSHEINKIRLLLFRSAEMAGWTVSLSIRDVDPDTHLPVGADLYSTYFPAEDLPQGQANAAWIDIPVTPSLAVEKGTEYAILLSAMGPL